MTAPLNTDVIKCWQCCVAPATNACCSSHDVPLCHRCYRRTHFVWVCVEGCAECAAEGLPLVLTSAVVAATIGRKSVAS